VPGIALELAISERFKELDEKLAPVLESPNGYEETEETDHARNCHRECSSGHIRARCAVPLFVLAALLIAWGLRPQGTRTYVERLPGGNYVLKALAKLDSTISNWS
jgi:hypothetical protein